MLPGMAVENPYENPYVSVITTVYNGQRFLPSAIESMLAQTFTAFEYILVDDASTDRSRQVLAHYADLDPRVRVLHNPVNLNMSGSLNRALELARGEYCAILDQDDIAHPQRLERQAAFLDTHPEVGVVGAQAMAIDEHGLPLYPMPFPERTEFARWVILFGSPVLHSAAMLRRTLVLAAGGYSISEWFANDYILFATLLRGAGIANLPDTLASYRRHHQQMASVYTKIQRGQVWLLIYSMLAERLGLRVALDDIGVLYKSVRGERLEHAGMLERAADLLLAIRARYQAAEQPDPMTCDQIDADCARRLLTMAWVHRHVHRPTCHALLRRALEIDPLLWQRPQTRALLRRLGRRHRIQAK